MSLHLRLTYEDWQECFVSLTRAELGVLFAIRTLDPYGDRELEIDCTALGNELGLHRTSVSRAIELLKQKQFIDFEIVRAKVKQKISNKRLTLLRKPENGREMEDEIPEHPRTVTEHPRTVTEHPRTNRQLETLPDKASGSPHTLKTYKEFFNTLSEPERERFLNFCNKKTEGFTKPIASIPDWLASQDSTGNPRFEDYYQQFKKSPHEVRNRELQEAEALRNQLASEKIYWEAHPEFARWVIEIAIAKTQTPFIEDVRKLFLAIDPESFDRSDFWEWVILSRYHIPAAPAAPTAPTAPTPSISTSEPLGAHTEEGRHSFKDKLKAKLEAKKNGGRMERQRRLTTLSPAELANLEMSIKTGNRE